MNKEFHYDYIYFIASKAGYNKEESFIIASSSQQVDDNKSQYNINEGNSNNFKNYTSQTINIFKPQNKLLRRYVCFHFIPGDKDAPSARRKDFKTHILNTTPDSQNAQHIFKTALALSQQDGNLYRIGIASHAFADTWAHQNFIGGFNDFNNLKNFIPNFGHLDLLSKPDQIDSVWEDTRLIPQNQKIDNKERFIEAGVRIFEEFYTYKSDNLNISKIKIKKEEIRLELYRIAKGDKSALKNIPKYNKNIWFKSAIKSRIRWFCLLSPRYEWVDINRYKDTHWYKFQVSIKEYQKSTLFYLRDKVLKFINIDNI